MAKAETLSSKKIKNVNTGSLLTTGPIIEEYLSFLA